MASLLYPGLHSIPQLSHACFGMGTSVVNSIPLLSEVSNSQRDFILQEALNVARLLKRVAFAILSGEMDQYVSFLPDVQGTLHVT